MKKLSLWAKILVGIGVGIILLIVVGALVEPDQTRQSNQSSQSSTNDTFRAAAMIGAVDGMAAYNRGDAYPTDEEFDSNGRAATANMTFNKAGDRQDWMDGYKAGFKIGWDDAKAGK